MKKALFFFLMSLTLLLSGCGEKSETRSLPEPGSAAPAENSAPETLPPEATPTPVYTVQYLANGALAGSESVPEGDCPKGIPMGGGFRCWLDAEGKTVRLNTVSVMGDRLYTAAFVPELNAGAGAFEPKKDGLFHPDEAFTRSDAVRLVYNLLKNKPAAEVFLKDVTTAAQCYKAASTLAAAGYIQLTDGAFRPDEPITLGELSALLEKIFPVEQLDEAMGNCPLPLTRASAAVLFASLLKLESGMADYPDLSPEHPYYRAVSALGAAGQKNWGARTGFTHVNGRLYCYDENGYFIKGKDVGTLHFGNDGAYTSGDPTLDSLVADLLIKKLELSDDREQNLRKAYLYVRDSFLYLRRNYYEVGETGWEISEATTMLQSGRGNCYNFTGVFWALARAMGYDAYCVSGLVGQNADPHSWVEIPWDDGVTYIFDPETEMSYRLKDIRYDCFKMTYEQGEFWTYYRGE